MSNIDTVQGLVLNTEQAFNAVLCDKSISFHREAEFATQIVTSNDYLMGVAVKAPQTLIDAVTNVAAIGVSLNPAKKHAYLVPRKNKVCLDISYMGLMDLAIQSGSLKWAQAEIAYENDIFEIVAVDQAPIHKRKPFSTDRGEIVGVYCVAKTADNDYLTDTMTIAEVHDIMNRSESVKAGKASPWKTDFNEMAKKTVVKRAQKYWPKTERLENAVHHMDTEGGEGINFTPEVKRLGDERISEMLLTIKKTEDAQTLASVVWVDLVKELRANGSMSEYEKIKDAVAAHGSRLKQAVEDAEFKEIA